MLKFEFTHMFNSIEIFKDIQDLRYSEANVMSNVMWHWKKGLLSSNLGLCCRYADMGGQLTCTRGSIVAATGIYM